MPARRREPGFEALVGENPRVVLSAERLRDGRIAFGTRIRREDGSWEAGELHLLEPGAYLDLAAWLTPAVEEAWIGTVREREGEPLQTARELYGEGPGAVRQLAEEIVREIPPHLLARAMIVLANSIGPEARERLIAQLNATDDPSEDAALRRRLSDENEAFAYVVAAAALFDALARGLDEV